MPKVDKRIIAGVVFVALLVGYGGATGDWGTAGIIAGWGLFAVVLASLPRRYWQLVSGVRPPDSDDRTPSGDRTWLARPNQRDS